MKQELWDKLVDMIGIELDFVAVEQKEQGIAHRSDQLNGLVNLIAVAQNLIMLDRETLELKAREQEIELGILSPGCKNCHKEEQNS